MHNSSHGLHLNTLSRYILNTPSNYDCTCALLLRCLLPHSNPRNEAAENELDVKNDKFGNLGVDFKSLDANLLDEVSLTLLSSSEIPISAEDQK
jgi:hypothetical protein